MVDSLSGVGVLDKAVALLDAVTPRPLSLGELTAATGVARPTAHRLAVALERHGLLARDAAGRFELGPRWREVGLAPLARPVLAALRDRTGESTQLYVRRGSARICVAAAERPSGLRDSVPVGAELPLTAGSGAQVLLAWLPAAGRDALLGGAAFSAATLAAVRRRGWAESIAEREAGVASVSAPVQDRDGRVVAAVCLSGPIERLGRSPGRRHAAAVREAAEELTRLVRTD